MPKMQTGEQNKIVVILGQSVLGRSVMEQWINGGYSDALLRGVARN